MTSVHAASCRQSGQTLIALLLFMMLVIAVTAAAAVITITNIRAGNGYAQSEQALMYAESGIDNALLRLSRDPSYSGETLAFTHGSVTISVSGTAVKTIIAAGTSDAYRRTVTVTITEDNGVIHRTSWSETQ